MLSVVGKLEGAARKVVGRVVEGERDEIRSMMEVQGDQPRRCPRVALREIEIKQVAESSRDREYCQKNVTRAIVNSRLRRTSKLTHKKDKVSRRFLA